MNIKNLYTSIGSVALCFVLISANINKAAAQNSLPLPWGKAEKSYAQFDDRVKVYLSPVRVVWQNVPAGGMLEGVENLLDAGNGQAELVQRGLVRMKGEVSVLLDFGRELQGGIQIVTGMSKSRDAKMRIRFGESVMEAMSEITPENGGTNDHARRDFEVSIPFLGAVEIGNSGYRFARIDLIGESSDVKIKEIRAAFSYRDLPYRGSFKCSDQRLNDIWMTGAYTVHLNIQDYIWDGVKRDRLVWIGDMHPEVMAINTVFGYNEAVNRSLDLVRDMTPLPAWMNNGYSAYSIWWLLIQRDWYMYQGNKAYLLEQQEYITGLLHLLMQHIDENGSEKLNGKRFLDWPTSRDKECIHAGLQGLMALAMDAGIQLSDVFGDAALKAECKAAKEKLSLHIPDHGGVKQAAALLALSGLVDAEKADAEALSLNGCKGVSTFYGYYMLEAMAAAGNYENAMEVIKEFWGAMLDLGATTFWEDFNIDWKENAARIDEITPEGKVNVHEAYGDFCYKGYRHSFCHGWASGPTTWLSRHVLGIEPVEAGFKKVRIQPHLGKLKWAEGTFPTPYGDIYVRHEAGSDGSVKSTIKAPKGVKVVR